MEPTPGPPLWKFVYTMGIRAAAQYEIPSLLSAIPGEDEDVMALTPADAAP